jgi:hypothetical protein
VTVLARKATFVLIFQLVEVFALSATPQKNRHFSLHLSHLEVLLSAATLPALLAIAGVQVVGHHLAQLEANSTEVFRGQRLPLLPFPPTEN